MSWCSSCLSLVLERLLYDLVCQPSSVAGGLADGPPRVHGESAWGVFVANGPSCLHGRSVIVGAVLEVCESFSNSSPLPRGRSIMAMRTVRSELADSPPGALQSC
jgi:hypothetical protein